METAACIFENNGMYTEQDVELIIQKMMEYLNSIKDQGYLYEGRAFTDDAGNLWVDMPQARPLERIVFTKNHVEMLRAAMDGVEEKLNTGEN